MKKQELFEKLKEFLVEHFEIDANSVSLESNFYTDLDLDSIDAIDLIVKLQELVDRKIAPEDFKAVRTVGDVVELVHGLIHT